MIEWGNNIGAKAIILYPTNEKEREFLGHVGVVTDVYMGSVHLLFDTGKGIFVRSEALRIYRDTTPEPDTPWWKCENPVAPSESEIEMSNQPEKETVFHFLPRYVNRFTSFLYNHGYRRWNVVDGEDGEDRVVWAKSGEDVEAYFGDCPVAYAQTKTVAFESGDRILERVTPFGEQEMGAD